jgi:hypothetical protein
MEKDPEKWNGNLSIIDIVLANCNIIILRIDEIEDVRTIYISEWSFRGIIKGRYQHLTACKKDILKSICTIRWQKWVMKILLSSMQ